MDDLTQYGIVGVAVGLILLAVKDLLKDIVTRAFQKGDKPESASVTGELARSIDRLAAVLDRMERFQERTFDTILENQQRGLDGLGRVIEIVQRVEFRNTELDTALARLEAQILASQRTWVIADRKGGN